MAKKDLKKLAEPLLNDALKNANYGELKKYASDLEIDFKSLKKMNENNLRKAIKEKLASRPVAAPEPKVKTVKAVKIAKVEVPTVVPYNELDKSRTFKVNYAFHHGVPKEEVIKTLGITPKSYVDLTWLYANAGYKQKIEAFLESEKAKS